MSAAARLLSRRSTLHLQQYRNSLTLLNPYTVSPLQTSNTLPKSVGRNRIFSALADGDPEKPPSKRRFLKFAAAGAAVIVLSAAAWYTTRDQYPQVQHVGLPLPQLWNGSPLEEKTTNKSVDRPLTVDRESDKVQEDEQQAGTIELEVNAGQLKEEVAKDLSEDIILSTESDSDQTERDVDSTIQIQQSPAEFGSIMLEKELVASPAEEPKASEQVEEEKPRTPEAQGDAAEALLMVEGNHVEKERDEVSDVKDQHPIVQVQVPEDMEAIRNKLRDGNPDMFFSEDDHRVVENSTREDSSVEGTPRSQEEPLLEEVMESGSHVHGANESVPSRVIASYVVQKGLDEHIDRYPESRDEKASQDLDVPENPIEEKEMSAEEEKAAEMAKVVGVDVLLGAIHTAEQMQAERDSLVFQEQLEKIQEAHKSEVKDIQAKVFAYAQDRDRLEKELKKEKELAEAELKAQLHEAEEKLESQLKRKEEEASKEKEKLEVVGKAQTAAAVAREKADHLENIHAMQLQVNALRTAFYAHSEEARISHTAHKLAMGAFALEDAVEKGKPVEKEAELLVASVGGPGGDPLVDAVVSSLPTEALTAGSSTRAQLHSSFTKMKGPLRELVLMPAGGGGVFAHLLAKVTAKLKITEQGSENVGDEGFEVVISKVERYLSEGKLTEAATVLERAAVGTAAERLATEWARQARNRAIIEQGLQVFQAHVIAIASEDAPSVRVIR
ncbi:MICOS complex subunit MIC60 [Marchantia polymorpha subsp. ruderalis]